jgi:predicted nuclease of predicted toxin-antitoxin system
LRFLVDAQLPPRLCRWLSARGHQALHISQTEGGLASPDALIWDLARAEELVLFSKDADFFDRAILYGKPPQVVQVSVGNCSNRDLLIILEEHWTEVHAALESDAPLIRLSRTKLEVFDLQRN